MERSFLCTFSSEKDLDPETDEEVNFLCSTFLS